MAVGSICRPVTNGTKLCLYCSGSSMWLISLPMHPSSGRQTGRLPALEVYPRSIKHALCCHSAVFTPTQFCGSRPPLNTRVLTTRRKTLVRTTIPFRIRCISSKRLVLFSVALLAMAIMATSASAQTCLQEEYNLVNKQKLNCTANDVSIAQVTNIRDPQTGAKLTSCVSGALFSFIADFTIKTTSSQARENIGLYISSNSQTKALTGSCVDNIIAPQHPCHTGSSIMCGSNNYHETDAAPDNCGDTSSSDGGGTGVEIVTLEIDNFLCQAPAGSNQVQLPNCTSWQIPGGTIQCVSPSPAFPYPFDTNSKPEAIPGSPAKCNCGVIPLGVTVQNPSVAVTKACTTTDSPGTNTSCQLNPGGGLGTYTVTMGNQSNFGDIVLDQACDDQ